MNSNTITALIITLLAGLSTGVGGLISIFSRSRSNRFLSSAMSFSAGIMIYISLTELIVEGREACGEAYGDVRGDIMTLCCFFGGVLLMSLLHKNEDSRGGERLAKTGIFTALAVVIHNVPEGIASFISGVNDPKLGLAIGLAIAIHNIPEGIAIGTPIYYSTAKPGKAVLTALASGLAEPLGGLIAFAVLRNRVTDVMIGNVLSCVAGIMVYISVKELLPSSNEYSNGRNSVAGFFVGIFIMAISLMLNKFI